MNFKKIDFYKTTIIVLGVIFIIIYYQKENIHQHKENITSEMRHNDVPEQGKVDRYKLLGNDYRIIFDSQTGLIYYMRADQKKIVTFDAINHVYKLDTILKMKDSLITRTYKKGELDDLFKDNKE